MTMIERVARAIADANAGEHTSEAQAANMARAAMNEIADAIYELDEERRVTGKTRGSDYICGTAGWLRHAALNEQVAG